MHTYIYIYILIIYIYTYALCVCVCLRFSTVLSIWGCYICSYPSPTRPPGATRLEVLNGAHLPAVRSHPWGLYRDHIAIYKPYTSHI